MRKTKTVNVEKLKSILNKRLRDLTIPQEIKRGYCASLELILHESGNYKGFQYCYWDEQGFKEWQAAGEPGGKEKNQYIVGNFGEYSRFYY